MSFEARSEELIKVLSELRKSEIPFVLVGGYAVSQVETRFSVDLDLVIASDDLDEIVSFLKARDFERAEKLEPPSEETIYDREIHMFERTEGLEHPIGVDILINGLGCRQTEAEWSFEYLLDHSTETTIQGGTSSTTARAAEPEILVAAKLHSARMTDLADVIAMVPAIDFDNLEAHLDRGVKSKLEAQLHKARESIEAGELDHRTKSVFGKSRINQEDLDSLADFLSSQLS